MNRNWLFGACVFALAGFGLVIAQPGQFGGRQGRPGGPGGIGPASQPAGGPQMRPRSPGDFGPPPCHPPRGNHLVKLLDADGDHMLSPEEIAAASEVLLTLDANEDGALSMEELRPVPSAPPTPEDGDAPPAPPEGHPLINRLDTDDSGTVSQEEFLAPAMQAFDDIDTDDNQEIDEAEAEAARPPRPPHHGGPGHGPCPAPLPDDGI